MYGDGGQSGSLRKGPPCFVRPPNITRERAGNKRLWRSGEKRIDFDNMSSVHQKKKNEGGDADEVRGQSFNAVLKGEGVKGRRTCQTPGMRKKREASQK